MAIDQDKVCLNIIAGCYERTVLGYEVTYNEKSEKYSIQAKFTDNSHIGYVKTIAASNNLLASGSTDETIHLYNLQSNTELGTLLQHDGTITCLCFHADSHMISSSEDGTLCVWDTNSWDCMKTLKGHKGGVNSIAIHPSGKLALSVGVDKTLRTWNLLKGRAAYTTNIKQAADHVLWSPDGELYVVIIGGVINVYNITTASIACTTNCKKRINAVTFITDRVVAVGGEGNNISLYEITKSEVTCIHDFEAHDNRIKGLKCVPACTVSGKPSKSHRWLVSASSDGYIKLWSLQINKLQEESPSLLAKISTTARLTCVTVRPTVKAAEAEKEKTQTKVTMALDERKASPKQPAVKRTKASSEHKGGKSKKKKMKP
ncbi:p21-activated protein kinase-interacting protein 1-like [Amphiura filiformis]|uniref:p21-activated protein kinase-interacting protein 1-like n=1 Tax=Amphiura filiformis TaxID=82378 RepID=UPI003B221BEF